MAEEITEDNFEKILLKRHPKLMSEQPKQDLEDNFDIMAKKMTKDQIDSLSEMENAVGKPGIITDSIAERKNIVNIGGLAIKDKSCFISISFIAMPKKTKPN